VIKLPKQLKFTSISYFCKTPFDIVCPRFWELKWIVGCPWNCSYCYLQGTLFGRKNLIKRKPLNKVVNELDRLFKWATEEKLQILLNSGEVADSCAVVSAFSEFLKVCSPLLKSYGVHKVLLVTKGGKREIKPLLDLPYCYRRFYITSFSINAIPVAKKYEKGPPNVLERIEAAKLCQENGYEVRIRLDPIIPVEGWKKAYDELIDFMFSIYELQPSRITLGTLRGLLKTIRFTNDKSWLIYLQNGEKTGWGLKMPENKRIEVYSYVLDSIRRYHNKDTALCKETTRIWKMLNLQPPGMAPSWANCKCNCVP